MSGVAERWIEAENQKWKVINERDSDAKRRGELVGRYVSHPYADSAAYYEVIRENKKSVRVRKIDVGDGWTLPAWGNEATVPKQVVCSMIEHRDYVAEFFASRDQ